jgi:nicotianamine synthase
MNWQTHPVNTIAIADKVISLLELLEGMPSLIPGPMTDKAFGELVATARLTIDVEGSAEVLTLLDKLKKLHRVRDFCSRGEYELERYWSHRLGTTASDEATVQELVAFPYLSEYHRLVAAEARLLKKGNPAAKHLLFIGSGPLPLSAYLLASEHGFKVDMVDSSEEAHVCAMSWIGKLPHHENLCCLHCEAENLGSLGDYDGVVLAALVGVEEADKTHIVTHLARQMLPRQPLLLRSANGLKRLLYPEILPSQLTGFDIQEIWHPEDDVINSVVLAIRS